MRVFLLVWLGQFVSAIGSRLTGFALGVWIYQNTASVTNFGLIYLFTYLPGTLASPLSGAFVDRCDRRWVMLISNCGAGFGILTLALLFFTHQLQIWQIYLILACVSTCNTFQFTAYTASITHLVPKQHFSRASGMVQLSQASSQILAPLIGGLLIIFIQIQGVILIDAFTFIFSVITLIFLKFPESKTHRDSQIKSNALFKEIGKGWNYITARPGILGLLLFFIIPYYSLGIVETLFTPFILNLASAQQLGMILSIGGLGWLLGSICISLWGGPKPRIYGVFIFAGLQGFFILITGLKLSITIATFGIIGYLFSYPILLSCSQTIWQSKIAPNMQGRVFGIRYLIEHLPAPIGYVTAGPLADRVFQPLFAEDGILTGHLGSLLAGGKGTGIAFMFFLIGLLNMIAAIAAYQYPPLRFVEDELPDALIDSID